MSIMDKVKDFFKENLIGDYSKNNYDDEIEEKNIEVNIDKNHDTIENKNKEIDSPVDTVPLLNIDANYKLPKLNEVLKDVKKNDNTEVNMDIAKSIIDVFKKLDSKIDFIKFRKGPLYTLYEFKPGRGSKIPSEKKIKEELKLSLGLVDIIIEIPLPPENVNIGIRIPNKEKESVAASEILKEKRKVMTSASMKLPIVLGRDINGDSKIYDLVKAPHLLIGGSTGSGLSTFINTIICSLLINKKPDEVKLILVDPKKVELSNYNGIPHLECPVITDPKKASIALQNVVREMERRYVEFENENVKNITGYNEKMDALKKVSPDDTKIRKMPYWLVIIDELTDLMMVASKEVEDSIMRITQMARATGIHLVLCVNGSPASVLSNSIKIKIDSRIAFSVFSKDDSRAILEMPGAEQLRNIGDFCFKPKGHNQYEVIHGSYILDEEIENVIAYISKQQWVEYNDSITSNKRNNYDSYSLNGENDDPLYNEIVDYCIHAGKVSASLLQRKFRLGYNRAVRIVDILEERGIIGPQNGSKPREVLVKMKGEEDE